MTNQRPHCSRTLDEFRVRGFEVLVENLGPAGAIRFIRSYSHGSGDYTREHRVSLERDLGAAVAGVLGWPEEGRPLLKAALAFRTTLFFRTSLTSGRRSES